MTINMLPIRVPNDIFIKVIHKQKKGTDRIICRFGINTAFVPFDKERGCFCTILDQYLVDPDKIKNQTEFEGFKIIVKFRPAC